MHNSDNVSAQGDHTSRATKLSDKTEAYKHLAQTAWPWKAGKKCLSMVCRDTCNDQRFDSSKRLLSTASSSNKASGSDGCVASTALTRHGHGLPAASLTPPSEDAAEEEEEDEEDEDVGRSSGSD